MKRQIQYYLLFVLLVGFFKQGITQSCLPVSKQEREALIDLFKATNGPKWKNNTNWNTSENVCDWYGVTVKDGLVTSVRLSENNLEGELPASIENLTNLQDLYLESNQLSGSIPEEVSNLSGLRRLFLYKNKFSGGIPESLVSMEKLEYLFLNANELEGEIPEDIGDMTSLRYLSLHTNKLKGEIPSTISQMSNLEHLYLFNNKLEGEIPSDIGSLKKLKRLLLHNNQLSGVIPNEIASLSELTQLYLNGNQLSGNIPQGISSLSELTQLYLNENKLSGSIPQEIGNLGKLTHLCLYSNALVGVIPAGISKLTQLQYLFLHANNLKGELPKGVIELTQLKQLLLYKNNLSGTLPEGFDNLQSLELAYFNENEFSGKIPESFTKLEKLKKLNVGFNQLSGEVPDFTQLPSLTHLLLNDNQFVFSDLEKRHAEYVLSIETYLYQNQAKVDEEKITSLIIGEDLVLNVKLESKYNAYQWYKDGILIPKATEKEYRIEKGEKSDVGTYHVEITNSVVEKLTLVRNNIYVKSGQENSFCLSEWPNDVITIADLQPQGSYVNWYLNQVGGSPLQSTFDIEDVVVDESYTFWWSYANGSRTPVEVFIDVNTPEGDNEQYFSESTNPSPTIADIVVENGGAPVYWFDAPYNGNLLDYNHTLVDGETYYASSCNDPKYDRTCPCSFEVTIHIGVSSPVGDAVQYHCKGIRLTDLEVQTDVGNDILWYAAAIGEEPLNPSTVVSNGMTYYASAINQVGEESPTRLSIKVYLLQSPDPIVSSPQTFFLYDSPKVLNLSASGNDSIVWYRLPNGGYQLDPLESLDSGVYYYAEQLTSNCPSGRVPVLVLVSNESAPPLIGCDLFKPQVGDSFSINVWVNERQVTPEIVETIAFNGSEASEAFTGLLNHLLNRLRSLDRMLHDFPEEYIPEFTGDETAHNLELILPFLEGITPLEKVLKVYDFQEEFDTYGRTIGFSFFLTKSKEYKFRYYSPKIKRIIHHYNGDETVIGPDRYPILDNLNSLELVFTEVSVNGNGKFVMKSNFDQQASPAYNELSIEGLDSDTAVNSQAIFYTYHEVAHQQSVQYEYGKVKIEFRDTEGNIMSSETVTLIPQGEIIEDWQKVASVFRIPVGAGQMVLSLVNSSDSKMCYFDDLRVLPFEGGMKSFVYHPETQRLMAELDQNNYATFYEYDKEGVLIRIKKETERGVFTIQETRSGNPKK